MHEDLRAQHQWLSSVLRGHYRYYGVPGNFAAMQAFYNEVKRTWLRSLRRRSQKRPMSWGRFLELLETFPLPKPSITQPSRLVYA